MKLQLNYLGQIMFSKRVDGYKLKGRICLFFVAFLVLILPATSSAATIDELKSQLSQIEQQLKDSQSKVDEARGKVKTLSDQVDYINNQIQTTQAQENELTGQIELTSAEIDQTSAEIKVHQDKIDAQKLIMDDSLAQVYIQGDRTPLEISMGQSSMTDYFSQTQYLDSVKNQTEDNIAEINKLKKVLDEKKKTLDDKNHQLGSLRDSLDQQQNDMRSQADAKESLISQTQGDENNYQALVAKLSADKDNLSASIYQQRIQQSGRNNETISGGGSGGYPYACDVIDPWRFYTCQCTSYASWYWNVVLGKPWSNVNPSYGNARNWPTLAAMQGYSVGSSPIPGAIAVWQNLGGYGHVAIVTGVNGNGTFNVSEYNYSISESFDTRSGISPGGALFIY